MIELVIYGEPASKANSRKLVMFGKRMVSVKGDKALDYEKDALRQIPPRARVGMEGPLKVTMRIFYASERPDLDESLVLDILQDRYSPAKKDKEGNVIRPRQLVQRGVYCNDRQVRERHIYHAIDRKNPRCEICIEPMDGQAQLLPVVAIPIEQPVVAAPVRAPRETIDAGPF